MTRLVTANVIDIALRFHLHRGKMNTWPIEWRKFHASTYILSYTAREGLIRTHGDAFSVRNLSIKSMDHARPSCEAQKYPNVIYVEATAANHDHIERRAANSRNQRLG